MNSRHPNHRRRGIASVWVALVGVMLITLLGLVMDTSMTYLASQQLQAAADSAALAMAAEMGYRRDDAISAAVNTAESYTILSEPFNNGGSLTATLGRFTPSNLTFIRGGSFDATGSQVTTQRNDLPLVFGGLANVASVNLSSTAATAYNLRTGGLFVLDTTAGDALRVESGAELRVCRDPSVSERKPASIFVQSSAGCAFFNNGNVSANVITVVGDDCGNAATGNCDGNSVDLRTGAQTQRNPVDGFTIGSTGPSLGSIVWTSGNSPAFPPGYYKGGIRVSGGTLNLASGVYQLDGAGLEVKGGNVVGNGVLIYVRDEPTTDEGGIYQRLSGLAPGHQYQFRAVSRDLGSTLGNTSATIMIGTEEPRDGFAYNGIPLAHWDTAMCAGWDGPAALSCNVIDPLPVPAGVITSPIMYLVIKIKQTDGRTIDVSFDEISLRDVSAAGVEKVNNGTFTQGTANWTTWTAEGLLKQVRFDSPNVPTGGSFPSLQLTANGTGSRVLLDGSGDITLSPGAGGYDCLTLAQSVTNQNVATFAGTSAGIIRIQGTIWFPGNHLDISGSRDVETNAMIVETLRLSGISQQTTINWTGCYPWLGVTSALVTVDRTR